jgi:two-component system, LytTR family, response regulator LytT
MNVLIIEDEIAASEHLAYLLQQLDTTIIPVGVLDSVTAAVAFFKDPPPLDLVFMDIHLADGLSFEIFDQTTVTAPIIFTTAYDQYALRAFKVNSMDYLLKPIDRQELAESLAKFKAKSKGMGLLNDQVAALLQLVKPPQRRYKSTFLVAQRDALIPLRTEAIAYLYMDNGMVRAKTHDNQTFVMDKTLEQLEEELDAAQFFRANRQFIVCRTAIAKLNPYFGGKLLMHVSPTFGERIVISKAKSPELKAWMDV